MNKPSTCYDIIFNIWLTQAVLNIVVYSSCGKKSFAELFGNTTFPDSKVNGANMGPHEPCWVIFCTRWAAKHILAALVCIIV